MLPQELTSPWGMLKPGALSVGLRTKTPLDMGEAMKGLARIGREFPELTESSFEKDQSDFTLRNAEPESEKQMLFKLVGFQQFEFVLGPSVQLDFPGRLVRLFECIQEEFGLYSINVEHMDLRYYVVSRWEGHHYRVIREAFLLASPLDSLFAADALLQNDLLLRGALDSKRTCIVSVKSDVTDNEVIRKRFEEDLLRAYAGVGLTRGIPPDARLSELFAEHQGIALDFIVNKFIPNVVLPLDRALVDAAKKGE